VRGGWSLKGCSVGESPDESWTEWKPRLLTKVRTPQPHLSLRLRSVTYHMSQIYKHDSTGPRVVKRPHSNCTDATRDTTTQSISALVARQAHLQLARLLLRLKRISINPMNPLHEYHQIPIQIGPTLPSGKVKSSRGISADPVTHRRPEQCIARMDLILSPSNGSQLMKAAFGVTHNLRRTRKVMQ
jgi:hypothetical protein